MNLFEFAGSSPHRNIDPMGLDDKPGKSKPKYITVGIELPGFWSWSWESDLARFKDMSKKVTSGKPSLISEQYGKKLSKIDFSKAEVIIIVGHTSYDAKKQPQGIRKFYRKDQSLLKPEEIIEKSPEKSPKLIIFGVCYGEKIKKDWGKALNFSPKKGIMIGGTRAINLDMFQKFIPLLVAEMRKGKSLVQASRAANKRWLKITGATLGSGYKLIRDVNPPHPQKNNILIYQGDPKTTIKE